MILAVDWDVKQTKQNKQILKEQQIVRSQSNCPSDCTAWLGIKCVKRLKIHHDLTTVFALEAFVCTKFIHKYLVVKCVI